MKTWVRKSIYWITVHWRNMKTIHWIQHFYNILELSLAQSSFFHSFCYSDSFCFFSSPHFPLLSVRILFSTPDTYYLYLYVKVAHITTEVTGTGFELVHSAQMKRTFYFLIVDPILKFWKMQEVKPIQSIRCISVYFLIYSFLKNINMLCIKFIVQICPSF